jgi:hypothetical protein
MPRHIQQLVVVSMIIFLISANSTGKEISSDLNKNITIPVSASNCRIVEGSKIGSSKRLIKEFRVTFKAKPDIVFPLLCVRRELEWIPNWKYEEIFSNSGYMEEGFVYHVPEKFEEKCISYVSGYDRQNHHLTILKFCDKYLFSLAISLKENANGMSDGFFRYEITALNDDTSDSLDMFCKAIPLIQPQTIQDLLNAYLTKKESIHKPK